MTQTIIFPEFELEDGTLLRQVPVAYRTWGTLSPERDNAIVICHALTGSADVDDWWKPLLGPYRTFDTNRYFVVAANVPGSPYGSISPLTVNPDTGRAYAGDFPHFTVRDTVRLHRMLLERLGVERVALAAGGSMGGMHVLEWAFQGDFVGALAPIAVGGRHAPWAIGYGEAQRQAIYADPKWQGGHYDPSDPPAQGLAAARMMAMLTYRSAQEFETRFGRQTMPNAPGLFSVESYLRYQGEKLVGRFDPTCYVRLTQQMDTHDVARGRGSYDEVLRGIEQPALVVGITSDVLYPLHEQELLADRLPNADLTVIDSPYGHDAFLIEFDALGKALGRWMETHVSTSRRPPLRAYG